MLILQNTSRIDKMHTAKRRKGKKGQVQTMSCLIAEETTQNKKIMRL